jgi:hypothetical protein
MNNLLETIFEPMNIEPHSEHYIPDHIGLMWFTVFANALVVVSYFLIPLAAVYLVRKRKDLVYNWVFLLIGLFIYLCGITHLMHIVTFWYPLFWLQGIIEIITAIASLVTFFALLYTVPKIVKLTSPKQLEEVHKRLEQEKYIHINSEEEITVKIANIETSNKIIIQKNLELQRLNKFMIGREEKIAELEKELEALQATMQTRNI